MSPSSIVDGAVFVALKSYLDGSQTDGISLTLAAISADESVWSELEPLFAEILSEHGAAYLHMTDAMSLAGEFEDWTESARDALLDDLIGLLSKYRENRRIAKFSCSVDLQAHRHWAPIRHHPSPERLCTRVVFSHIVDWYAAFPDPVLDVMDFWFDQNERFMTHVREDWENRKTRRKYPAWRLIRTIAPADSKLTIPLQIADMAAWARNRMEAAIFGSGESSAVGSHLYTANRIYDGTLSGLHREIGTKAMAESTFPESGLRRERLFQASRRRHS